MVMIKSVTKYQCNKKIIIQIPWLQTELKYNENYVKIIFSN